GDGTRRSCADAAVETATVSDRATINGRNIMERIRFQHWFAARYRPGAGPNEGRPAPLLFLWRHRAQPRHHRIEVVGRHLGVKPIAQRPGQLAAVFADALGDGALDLGVGPVAETLGFAGGDIAGVHHAPWAGEFRAAGA